MIVDQDHLSGGWSWVALQSIMLCAFCTNMAAAFALLVVQETLEGLHSYQDGDYSGILLRLEYLKNRVIINCGHLPDSIVAGSLVHHALRLLYKHGGSVRTCCCTRNFGAFRFLSGR